MLEEEGDWRTRKSKKCRICWWDAARSLPLIVVVQTHQASAAAASSAPGRRLDVTGSCLCDVTGRSARVKTGTKVEQRASAEDGGWRKKTKTNNARELCRSQIVKTQVQKRQRITRIRLERKIMSIFLKLYFSCKVQPY